MLRLLLAFALVAGALLAPKPASALPLARLLVYQDAKGDVWVAYTDFAWIARRHGITNRDKEFKMASEVIASITSTVQK